MLVFIKEERKFLMFVCEWVSYYFLMPNEQIFSHIMARISYIQWESDDYNEIITHDDNSKESSMGLKISDLFHHIILIW